MSNLVSYICIYYIIIVVRWKMMYAAKYARYCVLRYNSNPENSKNKSILPPYRSVLKSLGRSSCDFSELTQSQITDALTKNNVDESDDTSSVLQYIMNELKKTNKEIQ